MWDWFIDFWKHGDCDGWIGFKPKWRCSCCGWEDNDYINYIEKYNPKHCPNCGEKIVDIEEM